MPLFDLVSNLIFIKLIHFIRQLQTLTDCHACMHSSRPRDTWGKATYIHSTVTLLVMKLAFQYRGIVHYQMSVGEIDFFLKEGKEVPQISYFYNVLWTYKADEILLHAGLLHIKKNCGLKLKLFGELKICVQRDIMQCTVYWNQALVSNLDIKCFMIKSLFIDGGNLHYKIKISHF